MTPEALFTAALGLGRRWRSPNRVRSRPGKSVIGGCGRVRRCDFNDFGADNPEIVSRQLMRLFRGVGNKGWW